MISTQWIVRTILFAACAAIPASSAGEELPVAQAPCVYSVDRAVVTCQTDDFRLIMDEQARLAESVKLREIEVADLNERLRLIGADLEFCKSAAACPPPPLIVPASPLWPLVGLGSGVAGTLGLVGALGFDMPTEARLTVGGVALGALAAGVLLVLPSEP